MLARHRVPWLMIPTTYDIRARARRIPSLTGKVVVFFFFYFLLFFLLDTLLLIIVLM